MKLFASSLLAALLVSGTAIAQESPYYGQVNIGANVAGQTDIEATVPGLGSGSADVDHDANLFASAAFGRELTDVFSLEAEGLFLKHDLDTGEFDAALGQPLNADVKLLALLVNAKAEFMKDAAVSPYVRGGLGWGEATYRLLGEEAEETGLVWQIGAGATVPVDDGFALDFGYRYLAMPEIDEEDAGVSLNVETREHILTVGGRFNF